MTLSRLSICLSIAILLLIFGPMQGHAQDLDANGVPLPSDIKLETLKTVPGSKKRFSGAWIGTWSGETEMKHILIVERTLRSGRADVVFAWGDSADGNVRRGWERLAGLIKGDTLTLVSSRATYRFVNSQRLTAKLGSNQGQATMRSYSLPLLLRSKPADTPLPVDTARFDMRLTGKHDAEQSCAVVFDFRNGMAVDLDRGTFEIAVLSPDGKLGDIFQLRTPALKAAEAKAMKYRLPITCDQTGAIIGNGFTLCRGAQDYLERCNAALTMSSAIAVSFSNDVR